MQSKDERTKFFNEILNGIKIIKLYAWEMPMLKMIEDIRKKELFSILKVGSIKNFIDIFNTLSSFFVSN